jgi:hypothetical protein
MNPEIKSKWIEALRSGDYAQDKYVLHSEKGFCCLGVLCDITGLGEWKFMDGNPPKFFYQTNDTSWLDNEFYLPPKVKEFCDFTLEDARKDLSSMNDEGKSFSEIADWIEENM